MSTDPSTAAALAICESLCLTLREKGLLTRKDVSDLLTDAAEAFRALARESPEAEAREQYGEAADMVERMRDGGYARDLAAPPSRASRN